MREAYAAHPERFKGRMSTPPVLPEVAGINLPENLTTEPTTRPRRRQGCSLISASRCLIVIDTFRSRPHTSLQEQCQLAAEERILGLDRLRRSEKEQHPPEDVFD
jgi:hypothetical protein